VLSSGSNYNDYDSKITCTYVCRLIFSTDNGEERSEDDAITTTSSLTIEGGMREALITSLVAGERGRSNLTEHTPRRMNDLDVYITP